MATSQAYNRIVKALIVDDDRVTRMVHRMMLTGFGFEVTEAEDGKAAVDRFLEGNKHDLVLMDKQMPEMDGVEATRTLRRMGVNAKIVAITSEENSNGDFIEAGADGFLTKPVRRDELAELLKSFNLLN